MPRVTQVRTRLFRWTGPTVDLGPNLAASPLDLVAPGAGAGAEFDSFRFHSWLIVEVGLADGTVGLGNCALAPSVAKVIVDEMLAPLVLGEEAFDVEHIWQRMYRSTMAWGRKGIGMAAISAIDIALWDAMGKSVGKPVFRLLGGRTKPAIPVYASKLYSQPLDSLAAEAQSYLDQGYTMMKLRLGWGPRDGAAGMQRNLALVRTVREVVGDGVDVMVDCYMGWTLDYALRMLPLLAPFNLRWIEEPLIPDDIAGYAELRRRSPIPIAGGEHEFTLLGFRQLLDAGALGVIQYDTNRVGGITAAQKINALAEAHQIPVVPHAGQMHNYHLVMASLNCPMAEYFPVHAVEVGNELFHYIFAGEPAPVRGQLQLDDDLPGLGISVSDRHLARFEVVG